MNRITESSPCWMGEEMWASACEPDDEMMEEVYCKLWSYENTGLEPEEICLRASRWISVKDRLPPDQGKKVLVANGHGYISVFALWKKEYGNKWTWIDEQGHFKHTNDITHWMPLPKPPKEV